MGQSLRLQTQIGVDRNLSFQLDQDFEFLEILSLQIVQNDVYPRDCADFGVVVGRVVANGGFGIPNVKVSIFVPINEVDSLNDRIVELYPYTQPNDKNVDGYRFNLLPYVKSYSTHAATGTFPSRNDVLEDPVVVDIYDKYYKFTVQTNESGDFMILGVPVGQQTIVMDLDLSDIGEFSLTPQDLIRIGLATESQVAGSEFRTSTDLDTLPQIIHIEKTFEVAPFWGEPSICQSSISRIDFDLRDDANVDIQPTAVFLGSLFSTTDEFKIAAPLGFGDNPPSLLTAGCKPKDNMGNLCDLTAGPGQILAIRQTIVQDSQGRPSLEEYRLENSGNVIDENGTWLVEVPMNLDYVTTSEDGQRIFSRDPRVGIPTKGKYRFKVKWQQSPTDTDPIKRGYHLLPNVREWGWRTPVIDPNYSNSLNTSRELASSYYFGLDWTGYTDAEDATVINQKLQAAINCEDTFYEMEYNKVYTPAGLLDQYKRGFNRGRFLGVKEIGDNDCSTTVNKFPVNDGVKNFSISFFLFAILMQFIQLIFPVVLFAYHLVGFLINNVIIPIINLFIRFQNIVGYALIVIGTIGAVFGGAGIPLIIVGAGLLAGGTRLSLVLQQFVSFIKFKPLRLPMITYPECRNCDCNTSGADAEGDALPTSLLSPLTTSGLYFEAFEDYSGLPAQKIGDDGEPSDVNVSVLSLIFSEAIGTRTGPEDKFLQNRSTQSQTQRLPDTRNVLNVPKKVFAISTNIPMAQRINIFNTRKKYFDGENKISVSFDYPSNTTTKHFDNTLSLLTQSALPSGTLLTFVGIENTKDLNFLFTGNTNFNGITGTTLQSGPGQVTVNYATSQTSNSSKTYFLNSGSTIDNYRFPADLEYYQVLTAITVADAFAIASAGGGQGVCNNYLIETAVPQGNFAESVTVTYVDCSGNNQQLTVTTPFDPGNGYIQGFGNTCASTVPQIIQGVGAVSSTGPCNNPNPFNGLLKVLDSSTQIKWSQKNLDFGGWAQQTALNVKTRDFFNDFDNQYILILQRGVDPYSPQYVNRYGIGKILGLPDEDSFTFTANTRLNIPIQSLPSNNISVQQHTNQNNIFYPSYFFQAGNTYTAFTTPNVGYYSSIDGNRNYSIYPNAGGTFGFVSNFLNTPTISSVEMVTSKNESVNDAFSAQPNPGKYDAAEDLSGADFYLIESKDSPTNSESIYFSFSLLPTVTGTTTQMNLSNKTRNVLRTDRLPSSDFLDGPEWNSIVPVLQMNRGFNMYILDTAGENIVTTSYGAGATIVGNDIEDLPDALNVADTFSCANMVSLDCYSNSGNTLIVDTNCAQEDRVEQGCFVFARRLLFGLPGDLISFNEWGLRYRFFYALCQGVLSQTFTNNWVNGTLYTYPFQVRTLYGSNNQITNRVFCKDLVYYNDDSNNYYYRSSPYSPTSDSFIGKLNSVFTGALNDYSLQSPKTIMNLGPKTEIFKEITLNPSDDGFVMNVLNPTSYGDTSDLLNLFVISRITNSFFLRYITSAFPGVVGTNLAINSLFSRPVLRLDGDITQALSINSEFGVQKFTAQNYQEDPNSPNNPIYIARNPNGFSVMGIFYSSTTEDLQYKDYLSPGRINFRPTPNSNAFPYYYNLKSQRVPFYRWERDDVARWVGELGTTIGLGNQVGIFGTQSNDWATDNSDIFSKNYQSLDRTDPSQPSYFLGSNSQLNDIYAKGYIFNVDSNGNNSATAGNYPSVFAVGAPNHFYFGLINGATALDRFKSKYLADE
jgi:hypothetical protein